MGIFQFLQRVSVACYLERCIAMVELSVCHTLALCQNDSCYDHAVFTEDSPMTLLDSLDMDAK